MPSSPQPPRRPNVPVPRTENTIRLPTRAPIPVPRTENTIGAGEPSEPIAPIVPTTPIVPPDQQLYQPQDLSNASDAELLAFIRSNYGYFAAFLDNPEIRNVLFNAARQGFDEGRLYGAMTATSWWRNTTANQREWQRLQSEDPAEANRLLDERGATIFDQVRSFGIGMDTGTLNQLIVDTVVNGWTDTEVTDQILNNLNWSTVDQGGDLYALRTQIGEIAADYLTPMSQDEIARYTERIARGEMSLDGVRTIAIRQARARFGYMADVIDAGGTPRDFFAPIRNIVATELEMSPDSISLTDPQWVSLLEVTDDNGNRRAATYHEAQLAARNRDEWKATSNAQETGTQTAMMIADIFGRSGT